jgi:hypothetical protein
MRRAHGIKLAIFLGSLSGVGPEVCLWSVAAG